MPRLIKDIAREIKQDWKNISYYAKPYLDAMFYLETVNEYYYMDSATSIICYFLANASAWKGETARRIKQELKVLIK